MTGPIQRSCNPEYILPSRKKEPPWKSGSVNYAHLSPQTTQSTRQQKNHCFAFVSPVLTVLQGKVNAKYIKGTFSEAYVR